VVALRRGGASADEILAATRTKLASYKVPRAVVVVDEVPRTQVGKPDYPTARELFDAGNA
jgi:acyl-CoA synthetase (AMP-forming)/AMP-acid ligase II